MVLVDILGFYYNNNLLVVNKFFLYGIIAIEKFVIFKKVFLKCLFVDV